MESKILEKLQQIEKEKNIEILFAIESGSRAWGFASPDSDYDIRFVYKHTTEWYLNLWEQKDTIEFMTKEDLDDSGWDMGKALRLLAKSNVSFLEWLFSPIVYRKNSIFLKEIQQLAIANFNATSGFYHYHNMSKNFESKLRASTMTLKSFFYAIRTALCANWIVKNHTIPPVLFKELYSLLEPKYSIMLNHLIAVKQKHKEKENSEVKQELIHLVQNILKENEELKDSLPYGKSNPEAIQTLFIKTLSI
jgi:predicted nucleotidyltransferase